MQNFINKKQEKKKQKEIMDAQSHTHCQASDTLTNQQ